MFEGLAFILTNSCAFHAVRVRISAARQTSAVGPRRGQTGSCPDHAVYAILRSFMACNSRIGALSENAKLPNELNLSSDMAASKLVKAAAILRGGREALLGRPHRH